MTNKMLIDASHPEETRVVVLRGNRVEEFDFESASRKPLRGNIYLAKVTRVEPSLQAAFVDYGGNRHGFLAFSEIHPDYYQTPVADRQALLEEETRGHDDDDEPRRERRSRRHRGDRYEKRQRSSDESISEEAALVSEPFPAVTADESGPVEAQSIEEHAPPTAGIEGELEAPAAIASAPFPFEGAPVLDNSAEAPVDLSAMPAEASESEQHAPPHVIGVDPAGFATIEASENEQGSEAAEPMNRRQSEDIEAENDGEEEEHVEQIGGDAMEEVPSRPYRARRQYKIQEVIRRRQVLLVQVVKEERGNKGAALTTYLSLAGRYCVLMPNTSHGGGISRKISNGSVRKRLKQSMADLNPPNSTTDIARTAGLSRTKTEIKRDFDYLARLWDEIRDRTLGSSAPALIYGDSDLVKRAIRDIYNRDIDEVIVEGEDGYKAARNFMKLLMPSHVRRVKNYVDTVPLFQRCGAEDQLAAMYHPVVQLKSGGYLVINPTEALVSIDINSGRSTREHNIEQTAYATNLEAAQEIARQLRLRDMAGLVVIDFIDMESNGHIRKVEKAMKEALKNDRARIQVGRISSFGLMEMSRQRLRTGVLEASTKPCPHCEGSGLMRTAASAGLSALRMLEEEAARGRGSRIMLRAGREAAVYVLNKKRGELAEVEARYGVMIDVQIDESLEGARMSVESSGPRPVALPRAETPVVEEEFEDEAPEIDEESEDEDVEPRESRGPRGPRGPEA